MRALTVTEYQNKRIPIHKFIQAAMLHSKIDYCHSGILIKIQFSRTQLVR